MTELEELRAALALAGLKEFPPEIRSSILKDSTFIKQYGISTTQRFNFSSGFSVNQVALFESIEPYLQGRTDGRVAGLEGGYGQLVLGDTADDYIELCGPDGESLLTIPHVALLSNDVNLRLNRLREISADFNMPANSCERWRAVLETRAFQSDEHISFQADISDTPIGVERSVRAVLQSGEANVSALVPASSRYYERLIGQYDGSTHVSAYADNVASHFTELVEVSPHDFFLHCLYLSGHSSLTARIPVPLESDRLLEAYEFIGRYGDPLSKVGAIEVGLRLFAERPELEKLVLSLIRNLRDGKVDAKGSGFRLFARLFAFVDGEISRARIFSKKPPFYRRLASLSHAALLHRQIAQADINVDRLSEWGFTSRAEQFYIQSLSDMRAEPRWNPDLASEAQFKNECLGRIVMAAASTANIPDGQLRELVTGNGKGSLKAVTPFPMPYLPGPLEGSETNAQVLPDELSSVIEKQLTTESVEVSSFVTLVNSSLLFKVPSDKAGLAANALRLGNYRLRNLDRKEHLISILNGLATVAAVGRIPELADEVRVLVRRYRYTSKHQISIDEAIKVCLVASASRSDFREWCDLVGEWLTELAFGDLKEDEGSVLRSRLGALLDAVPELWVTAGRADAALRSLAT